MNQLSLTQQDVQRRIYRLLAITGILTVATMIGLSLWMSRTVDEIAQENAQRLVDAALRSEETRISQLTQDYADSETAFEWVIARDADAIYDNIGTGTTELGFSDYSYIYGPDRALWYAFEYGGEASDLSLEMATTVAPYLEALSPLPIEPYQIVSGFAEFNGNIAFIAAGRNQPYNAGEIGAAALPVLINVTVLSDDLLTQIGEDLLIENLQASPGFIGSESTTEAAKILANVTGTPIGTLTWAAPSQGREMLARNLWITAFLSFVVCFGHFVVARISFRQTQAFLAESLQARLDSLTGLLNRKGFDEYVAEPACVAAIARGKAALIYLDMDDFKSINDIHGHHAGDMALKGMAKRLRDVTRPNDTIARIGGDEFVVLIQDGAPDSAVRLITSRLQAAAKRDVRLYEGVHLPLTASIGAAIADRSSNWRKLMLQADAAMYDAKRDHKARTRDAQDSLPPLDNFMLESKKTA